MAERWRNRIVDHGDVSPEELLFNPRNWRKHSATQRAALERVLDRVGWVQDVIVNRRTGRLVDGHLRVAVALERHEPTLPVLYVDLDEGEERLVLATLDPLSAMADADVEALTNLVASLVDEDGAVQDLLDQVVLQYGASRVPPDDDDIPSLPPAAVSQIGDLWVLGEHRLLCGDATAAEDVGRVLAGEPAEWMWTDPPYGVSYEGGTSAKLTIKNDTADVVERVIRPAFGAVDQYLADGAPLYVCHPAGALSVGFGAAFLNTGWHLHETLVWVKDAFVLGHSDYHYRHEPILYGWKSQRPGWYGGRSRDSVFEVPRPHRNDEHPTAKPVALIVEHLRNSTTAGSLGLEPFAGSGSTLVAAERLGRRCAAIELDPRYVDVAVERWQRHAGTPAHLEDDGRSFAQVQEVRSGR